MSHEENSVLFSLNHLKMMASAATANGIAPTRMPSSGDISFEVAGMVVAPTPILYAAHADERPRWLLPTIIGLGSLFVVVVVLGIAVAVRKPAPVVAPTALAALAAPVTTTPAPPTATSDPTKVASALPMASEQQTETATAVEQGSKTKERKIAKGKRGKRGKAARFARGRGNKRAPMVASRSTSPSTKSKRSRKPDALDALIDSAMRR